MSHAFELAKLNKEKLLQIMMQQADTCKHLGPRGLLIQSTDGNQDVGGLFDVVKDHTMIREIGDKREGSGKKIKETKMKSKTQKRAKPCVIMGSIVPNANRN